MSARTSIIRLIFLFLCLATILPCIAPPAGTSQGTGANSTGEASAKSQQLSAQSDNLSPPGQCDQVIALLQQQRSLLTRELAQIKRELAALKESMSEPGLPEIFAGIGYILGFVGIAFFVHGKKSSKDS